MSRRQLGQNDLSKKQMERKVTFSLVKTFPFDIRLRCGLN